MALQHVAGFATGQSYISKSRSLLGHIDYSRREVGGAEEKLARTARWHRGLQPSSVQTPSASLYAEEQRLLFIKQSPNLDFLKY